MNVECSRWRTRGSPAHRSRHRRCGAPSRLWGRASRRPRIGTQQPLIRFVLEGDGVWTQSTVMPVTWRPATWSSPPRWTFHDHTNGGDTPMLWFDGLDLPLAGALDAILYDNHPDMAQSVRGYDLSEQTFAVGCPRCLRYAPNGSPLAVTRVPMARERCAAHVAHRGIGRPDRQHRIRRPHFGRPGAVDDDLRAAPDRPRHTNACGAARRAARSLSCTGARAAASSPGSLRLKANDIFVVPSWQSVHHESTVASDLFEVSDEVVLLRGGTVPCRHHVLR